MPEHTEPTLPAKRKPGTCPKHGSDLLHNGWYQKEPKCADCERAWGELGCKTYA